MGVKTIHNEIPFFGIRVAFNCFTNMFGKVIFGSGVSASRADNLTSDDIKICN
jgi:hypothetical protein